MNKRIYFVDASADTRRMMEAHLKHENYDVTVFSKEADCLSALCQGEPDLLLFALPPKSGAELRICDAVRRKYRVPLVLLQQKDDPIARITALSLGADAVFVYQENMPELLAWIKAILRRIAYERQPVKAKKPLQLGSLLLSPEEHTALYAGKPLRLTPHEFEFLLCLLRSGGATRKTDLLHEVWQLSDAGLETNVADDLVKRLRKKLLADGGDVRLETIWGYGYRLVEASVGAA